MWELIKISKIVNKKKVVEKASQTEIKTIKKTTTDDEKNKTKTSEVTKEETAKEENNATNNETTPEVIEIQDTATSRGITIWLGLFICTTTIIYVNKQKRYE